MKFITFHDNPEAEIEIECKTTDRHLAKLKIRGYRRDRREHPKSVLYETGYMSLRESQILLDRFMGCSVFKMEEG